MQAIITARDLETHEDACPFAPAKCGFFKYGCRLSLASCRIKKHEDVCPFKRTSCKYEGCDHVDIPTLVQTHEETCTFTKVICPHQGCRKQYEEEKRGKETAMCAVRVCAVCCACALSCVVYSVRCVWCFYTTIQWYTCVNTGVTLLLSQIPARRPSDVPHILLRTPRRSLLLRGVRKHDEPHAIWSLIACGVCGVLCVACCVRCAVCGAAY